VLASERLGEVGLEGLRPWREAVREYVATLRDRWEREAGVDKPDDRS